MKPGRTLFMRIFCDAYSSAYCFVNDARAARMAADVGNAGSGSNAANVEMLTIDPPPRDCRTGVTKRVRYLEHIEQIDFHR